MRSAQLSLIYLAPSLSVVDLFIYYQAKHLVLHSNAEHLHNTSLTIKTMRFAMILTFFIFNVVVK